MWRDVINAVLFAVRWRHEITEAALSNFVEDAADRKDVQRTLSALQLESEWKLKTLLSQLAAYGKDLDGSGLQRKTAAHLMKLYVRTAVDDAISRTARSLMGYFEILFALVVATGLMSGFLAAFSGPDALLMYLIAIAVANSLTLIIDRYVPQLGPYDYRLAPLAAVGAAVGYLLGGVDGFVAGLALGAAPHTALWFAKWRRYEGELAKFGFILSAAREGDAVGRTVLAEVARKIYDHVRTSGSFDLESFARDVLALTARFFIVVRSEARKYAVATLALMAVTSVVIAFSVSYIYTIQRGAQLPQIGEIQPVDLSPIVIASALAGIFVGRLFDSYAAAPLFSAVIAAVARAAIALF